MTHARVQSAAARLVQADRALRTGIITLNGTVEGLEQTNRFGDVLELVSRPQEAVYALQLLDARLHRVLHHRGRVQPLPVRPVPGVGLPGAGGLGLADARHPGADAAGPPRLPAPGRKRPTARHTMSGFAFERPVSGRWIGPVVPPGRVRDEGVKSRMKDCTRLPSTLVLACLLAGLCTGRSPAQEQLEPMMRPIVSGADAMPSAVSADVARSVTQNGRDSSPRSPTAAPRRPAGPAARQPGRNAGETSPPLPPPPSRPSPLSERPGLPAAPTDPDEVRLPINLAAALRLADARPLIVAAAQARTWISEAELARAKVLWIPALNIAYDYVRHDGGGPDFNKGIITTPSTNFTYAGRRPLGIHLLDRRDLSAPGRPPEP